LSSGGRSSSQVIEPRIPQLQCGEAAPRPSSARYAARIAGNSGKLLVVAVRTPRRRTCAEGRPTSDGHQSAIARLSTRPPEAPTGSTQATDDLVAALLAAQLVAAGPCGATTAVRSAPRQLR
jgi:hypothetical protein